MKGNTAALSITMLVDRSPNQLNLRLVESAMLISSSACERQILHCIWQVQVTIAASTTEGNSEFRLLTCGDCASPTVCLALTFTSYAHYTCDAYYARCASSSSGFPVSLLLLYAQRARAVRKLAWRILCSCKFKFSLRRGAVGQR